MRGTRSRSPPRAQPPHVAPAHAPLRAGRAGEREGAPRRHPLDGIRAPPSSPAPISRYTPGVPIFRLGRENVFPDPELAEPDGLLAVGGDLSPERLLTAYAAGIFPWYGDDTPILWWSPDPRLVLEPERLHVSASLARTIRRGRYRVTADRAFEDVIRRCAARERPGQD